MISLRERLLIAARLGGAIRDELYLIDLIPGFCRYKI